MIWTILAYLFYALLAYLLFLTIKSYMTMAKLSKGGVVWCRFFPQVTDTFRLIKAAVAQPYRIPISPIIETYYEKERPPKAAGLFLFGTTSIIFNKVSVLNELYVTKNQFYTKHENERAFSQPLLFNNIVSMDTADPTYKTKRKSLSQAFFKNKIRLMMQQVKKSSLKLFKELQATADSDGKCKTDLVKFTTRLQNHIITSVLIGEDEAFTPITFLSKKGEEQMDVSDFIDAVLTQFFDRIQENIPAIFVPALFNF